LQDWPRRRLRRQRETRDGGSRARVALPLAPARWTSPAPPRSPAPSMYFTPAPYGRFCRHGHAQLCRDGRTGAWCSPTAFILSQLAKAPDRGHAQLLYEREIACQPCHVLASVCSLSMLAVSGPAHSFWSQLNYAAHFAHLPQTRQAERCGEVPYSVHFVTVGKGP